MGIFSKVFGSYSTRELARIEPLKKKVLELDEEFQALSDADLKEKTNEFRERLEDGEAFNLNDELSARLQTAESHIKIRQMLQRGLYYFEAIAILTVILVMTTVVFV